MNLIFYFYLNLYFQVGERIRVILDCDDNTLAFERNYEFLGVAFRGGAGLPHTSYEIDVERISRGAWEAIILKFMCTCTVHVGGIGTDFNTFVHPEKVWLGHGLKGVIIGKGEIDAICKDFISTARSTFECVALLRTSVMSSSFERN